MNCIFCKENSDSSISKEHIIPESLGNSEHILPKGVVCDRCNSYFAIKIEKELLNQPYFRYIRFAQDIFSKKGKAIPGLAFIGHPKGGIIDIYRDSDGIFINVSSPEIADVIVSEKVNKLYILRLTEPFADNVALSRLLGKMAIEALTKKILHIEGWETEIIDKSELDPLRSFVRYGPGKIKFWKYSQRLLYSPTHLFKTESDELYEVLHEYTFHYSEKNELFFIIAIFGVEYAINLSSPEIDSYSQIIRSNSDRSLLY